MAPGLLLDDESEMNGGKLVVGAPRAGLRTSKRSPPRCFLGNKKMPKRRDASAIALVVLILSEWSPIGQNAR